jgi:hypothetical protein
MQANKAAAAVTRQPAREEKPSQEAGISRNFLIFEFFLEKST